MRFAYIDSQGNEVPIPGVDALALRIELGAIGPDTQLYDATADHWGPAETHEIFHTLSRAQKDEGFVAPPPPVASAPVEAPESEEPAAPADDEDAFSPLDLAPGAEAAAAEPTPEPPPSADGGDLGFDFTLADEPGGESAGAPAASDGGSGMDLDFGGATDPSAPAGPEGEGAASFDFQGMDTLELEGGGADDDDDDDADDDDDDDGIGAMGFGGGMALEEPLADGMDFSGGGDDLQLEQPMSEFTSDAPPAWMEQDGPSGGVQEDEDDGGMDFAPGGADADDDPDSGRADREPARPPRERPEPKNRPSPPRRVKQRSFAGPALGVLALLVIGGGGWFIWNTFLSGGGSAPPAGPTFAAVTIPDIPAELLPQMRDLGERALAGTVAELASLPAEIGLADEPRSEWLSGAYLANASQFADIEAYWEGLEAFIDRVRSVDTQIFHDQYVVAMDAAQVPEETQPILLERADSGFLATRSDRFDAYARMDDLVNAALDLHEFLLANEANIAFEPAAGGRSRDPVLEAVPATPELGREMWGRVDRITRALDGLGTLDRVTTERLSAVLFDRIRRAGIE